jgi:D-alanine-D-alanine ligase
MPKKLKVGVICGGVSAEHEVSLLSTLSVCNSLDPSIYDVELIGIDKKGRWLWLPISEGFLNVKDPKKIALNLTHPRCEELTLKPWAGSGLLSFGQKSEKEQLNINVFFPVLHGPRGEDGTIQSILKLAEVPFVGPNMLGAVLGMDKDVMKRLLRDAEIPIAKFIVLDRYSICNYEECAAELGSTMFVKPANMGSSVGVTKVVNSMQFNDACKEAFKFDLKIVVEEAINGREIECAVLGNQAPKASLPGELVATHDFYSYEAKYLDSEGAKFQIPVILSDELTSKIQGLAIKSYKVLGGEGMARIDFFLKNDDSLLVNEINTIPGFTSISMYPKLWEVSGLPYRKLLSELINLAIERFELEMSINKTL